MRQLDSMYNAIFADTRLRELFLNFWGPVWSKTSVEDKVKIMTEINERVAKIYGYSTPALNQVNNKNYGSFAAFNWKLTLNPDVLANDTGWENIDTYFHELRHSFQHRAIENELTDSEKVEKRNKYLWQRNFLPGNYFGGEHAFYLYQPVEEDAWRTGMLFAREVYKLCREHYSEQEDETWKTYCTLHKNIIVDFISENEDSKEKLGKIGDSIKEIYDGRQSDLEQIEIGKKFIANLEKVPVSEMTFEQVAILLSPYAFTYIDVEKKVELLNRYVELIKVGRRKIPVKENTVASISVGGHLYSVSSSLTLVNAVLSVQFKNIVDYVLKGQDVGYTINENAKKELILNLYKNAKNKKINYVGDVDNLFVFSLQPYARYESSYILKEFKKLKEIELQYYGKNYDGWKYWEDFYDNGKIYKMAEEVFGMKFKDYYKALLATYAERIKQDKAGTLEYSDSKKNSIELQKEVNTVLRGTK